MGRSLLTAIAILLACVTPRPVSAQRPPPPIIGEFEEAPDAPAPGETQPSTEAEVPPPRPLPPIVSDFDGPMDEDEPADPLMPTPDDDESGEGTDDEAGGVADEDDEDPVLARRLLQHSLLVERRRDMAARLAASPNARLLASPFRDRAASDAPASTATESDRARLPRAIDRLELGGASANAPVTSVGVHDDGLRMRVGVGLDAMREPNGGFRVRFEPMVALATDGTLSAPRDFVRTAFLTTVTYRTTLPDEPIGLFVGGGYEHVGDYTTLGSDELTMTNALVLRGGALFDAGVLHGLVRASLRVHVLSQTVLTSSFEGGQTAELGLDVILRSGSPESVTGNVQLCGALHASYVAGNGVTMLEEAHLDAMIGACARADDLGELALVLDVGLGNESEWDRRRQTEHVGVALRWSL